MPLQLSDILPEDRRSYDKMEPPKKEGKGVGSVSCLFRLLFRRQLDWMQQQQLDGFSRFRETDDRLLSRDGDEFGLDRREFHGKSISSKRIAGSRVVMWCGSFRWGGGIGPALAVIALRTVASAFRPRLFLMTMMNSLRDGASPLKKKLLHIDRLISGCWFYYTITMWSVADVRGRHFLLADVAGLPAAVPGQPDGRLPTAAHLLAQLHVEAGLVLQERKESHLPGRHHPQPLHLALQGQEHPLHGQVRLMPGSLRFFLFFKLFFFLNFRFHRSAIRRHRPVGDQQKIRFLVSPILFFWSWETITRSRRHTASTSSSSSTGGLFMYRVAYAVALAVTCVNGNAIVAPPALFFFFLSSSSCIDQLFAFS